MITADLFRLTTGTEPTQDDLERCNCKDAGKPGHWDCGWCNECNKPFFMCPHSAPRVDTRPQWTAEQILEREG